MPTLDTNIGVRHLTTDHPDHSARARNLFRELAAGTRYAWLREAVLVEMEQVLSSKALYNLPRERIFDYLSELILMPGILIQPKSLYLRALDIYRLHTRLSFVDALLAAAAERDDGVVLSFDRGFDRVPSVTRIEP